MKALRPTANIVGLRTESFSRKRTTTNNFAENLEFVVHPRIGVCPVLSTMKDYV